MKKFSQTLEWLSLAALFIASCVPRNSPITIKVSPTVLPSPTIILRPSLAPASTSVAPTLLSTLTPNEAAELVKNLLKNNAGCKLPCWWGIIPGKTSWLEAHNFLESFAIYIGETGEVQVPLPSPYSDATYMEQGYFIKNGIVDYIEIYNFNLAPNYYLPRFLETYGTPEEIWIRTFAKEEMGIQNFVVDLYYKDLGVLMEYSTGKPLIDVDGKLRNCLIQEMDSPHMFLWSPEKQNLTFQVAKQKFLDVVNLPEPKPLFEATNMDIRTF